MGLYDVLCKRSPRGLQVVVMVEDFDEYAIQVVESWGKGNRFFTSQCEDHYLLGKQQSVRMTDCEVGIQCFAIEAVTLTLNQFFVSSSVDFFHYVKPMDKDEGRRLEVEQEVPVLNYVLNYNEDTKMREKVLVLSTSPSITCTNCYLVFDTKVRFLWRSDLFDLKQFEIELTAYFDLTIETLLHETVSGAGSATKELYTSPKPEIQFFVGYIPIYIKPGFEASVGVEYEYNAELKVSHDFWYRCWASFGYFYKEDGYNEVRQDFRHEKVFEKPQIQKADGDIEVILYFLPKITLEVGASVLGNPFEFSLKPYLRIAANADWLAKTAAIDFFWGVRFLVDVEPMDIYGWEFDYFETHLDLALIPESSLPCFFLWCTDNSTIVMVDSIDVGELDIFSVFDVEKYVVGQSNYDPSSLVEMGTRSKRKTVQGGVVHYYQSDVWDIADFPMINDDETSIILSVIAEDEFVQFGTRDAAVSGGSGFNFDGVPPDSAGQVELKNCDAIEFFLSSSGTGETSYVFEVYYRFQMSNFEGLGDYDYTTPVVLPQNSLFEFYAEDLLYYPFFYVCVINYAKPKMANVRIVVKGYDDTPLRKRIFDKEFFFIPKWNAQCILLDLDDAAHAGYMGTDTVGYTYEMSIYAYSLTAGTRISVKGYWEFDDFSVVHQLEDVYQRANFNRLMVLPFVRSHKVMEYQLHLSLLVPDPYFYFRIWAGRPEYMIAHYKWTFGDEVFTDGKYFTITYVYDSNKLTDPFFFLDFDDYDFGRDIDSLEIREVYQVKSGIMNDFLGATQNLYFAFLHTNEEMSDLKVVARIGSLCSHEVVVSVHNVDYYHWTDAIVSHTLSETFLEFVVPSEDLYYVNPCNRTYIMFDVKGTSGCDVHFQVSSIFTLNEGDSKKYNVSENEMLFFKYHTSQSQQHGLLRFDSENDILLHYNPEKNQPSFGDYLRTCSETKGNSMGFRVNSDEHLIGVYSVVDQSFSVEMMEYKRSSLTFSYGVNKTNLESSPVLSLDDIRTYGLVISVEIDEEFHYWNWAKFISDKNLLRVIDFWGSDHDDDDSNKKNTKQQGIWKTLTEQFKNLTEPLMNGLDFSGIEKYVDLHEKQIVFKFPPPLNNIAKSRHKIYEVVNVTTTSFPTVLFQSGDDRYYVGDGISFQITGKPEKKNIGREDVGAVASVAIVFVVFFCGCGVAFLVFVIGVLVWATLKTFRIEGKTPDQENKKVEDLEVDGRAEKQEQKKSVEKDASSKELEMEVM